MPQLTGITNITATLELLSGLHIGAGDSEMHIGGVDNTVIKHPFTQQPYIPGSSLKGRIRSLLEWRSGAVQQAPLGAADYARAGSDCREEVRRILQLFGVGGGELRDDAELIGKIGPSRLSFWDCNLCPTWLDKVKEDNLMATEVKSENRINRISGEAEHPRFTERVPAGALFDFRLSLKRLAGDSEDLLHTTLAGLRLLELDSLGGSGSRGYGKLHFTHLQVDGQAQQTAFDAIQPFVA